MKRSRLSFWCFVAPSLLAFIIVVIIPLFFGIYYSFTDWNGINADVNFTGLRNYQKSLPITILGFIFLYLKIYNRICTYY